MHLKTLFDGSFVNEDGQEGQVEEGRFTEAGTDGVVVLLVFVIER